MNELNLLLRQQIIKHSSVNSNIHINCSMNTPQEAYYEEEYSKSLIIPKQSNLNGLNFEDRCEELRTELANIQLEESTAVEHHKKLCNSYDLLELVIEQILHHIECVILESKSASRLSLWINSYAIHEHCITGQISNTLKKLTETPDLSTLRQVKAKLLLIPNSSYNLKKLFNEFQERQGNYKLALKNFKIILEILNVNEESLRKLKQQFDEVLMDYQHFRCILDQELPFAIAERTKVLVECLNLLGNEYDLLTERRNALQSLLKDIGQKVEENEYILVKKDLISCSSDNE